MAGSGRTTVAVVQPHAATAVTVIGARRCKARLNETPRGSDSTKTPALLGRCRTMKRSLSEHLRIASRWAAAEAWTSRMNPALPGRAGPGSAFTTGLPPGLARLLSSTRSASDGRQGGPSELETSRARTHDIWGHDDDEFGLVLLKPARSEQSSEDRNVAEPGHVVHVGLERPADQAPDGEALTAGELDDRIRAPVAIAGIRKPLTSTAPLAESSLTSGLTRTLMRSPESTVGTNSRLTPNRRKSTDTRSDP